MAISLTLMIRQGPPGDPAIGGRGWARGSSDIPDFVPS